MHNWQALCALFSILPGQHDKFIEFDFSTMYEGLWWLVMSWSVWQLNRGQPHVCTHVTTHTIKQWECGFVYLHYTWINYDHTFRESFTTGNWYNHHKVGNNVNSEMFFFNIKNVCYWGVQPPPFQSQLTTYHRHRGLSTGNKCSQSHRLTVEPLVGGLILFLKKLTTLPSRQNLIKAKVILCMF